MGSGQARGRMPGELDRLLTSEKLRVIEEANLGAVNTQMAQLYYIEQMPQMEIGEELGFERSVVSRRLKGMAPRLTNAAARINLPQ